MGLVVLIGQDEEFHDGLAEALAKDLDAEIVSVAGQTAATEIVERRAPHVVVTDPWVVPQSALDLARRLASERPETAAVLVVTRLTTDLLRQAMRAGVKDVVSVGDGIAASAKSVIEAYDASERQRRASVPAEAVEYGAGERRATVITVFSNKGGVGKSVLATNLGVALARHHGKRAIILDLDLQFGDTAIMLSVKPERTIVDAVQVLDRLDTEMLGGFLSRHVSGAEVLPAPVRPEDAESITAARVSRIIELLSEMADFVVVDTPAAFSDVVLAALDRSDEILAVATMDIASVKNTRISLQKLGQLGYDSDTVRVVLNRADSKVWLQPGDVEKAVERDIVAKIPSDRLVPRSVNKGVPVVIDEPRSAVARSIVALAGDVVAEKEGETGDVS